MEVDYGTHRTAADPCHHGARSTPETLLFTALLSGLSDQQIANDPGGNRWLRLVDAAVDMYLAYVNRTTDKSTAPKKERLS